MLTSQVERGASDKDVKRAYRQLSLQYHPDKNPDPAAAKYFAESISKAYKALTGKPLLPRRCYCWPINPLHRSPPDPCCNHVAVRNCSEPLPMTDKAWTKSMPGFSAWRYPWSACRATFSGCDLACLDASRVKQAPCLSVLVSLHDSCNNVHTALADETF